MHDTLPDRAPERGAHVRAMNYAAGSVAAGTHSWAVMSFTGTVAGTVRDGAKWVAIALDRDLTVPEHAALVDAGARMLSAGETTAVIIPADTLDAWTFETLAAPAAPILLQLEETSEAHMGEAVFAFLDNLARQGRKTGLAPTPPEAMRQYPTLSELAAAGERAWRAKQ